MRIVGYYRDDGKNKDRYLSSFLEGCKKFGHHVELTKVLENASNIKRKKYDLCVVIGHSKQITIASKKQKCPRITIYDPFVRPNKFRRSVNDYYSVCWGPPYFGHYYMDNLSNDRWKKLSRKYRVKVNPWVKNGSYILIAYQLYLNVSKLYDLIINKCLSTGRKVIICSKPYYNINKDDKFKWKELGCQFNSGISNVLKNAYCLVSIRGTSPIHSILFGVSSYSFWPNITDNLIKRIKLEEFLKDPPKPDRTNWLNWVAYQQWTLEEMKKGLPFKYLMKMKEKYYA